MTINQLRAAFLWTVLMASAGGGLAAQTPQRPARPEPQPPVESPAVREPIERPEPTTTVQERDRRREVRFARPIVRIAQDYTLRAGDVVRDVRTIIGDATIEGRVLSDVVVIMGSARLGSTAVVEGSLVVVGGSATVDPGAAVERDLVVIGGTLAAQPGFSPDGEHVVIGSPWFGDVLQDVSPWVTRGLLWGRLIVPDLAWVWGVVGIFFLIYLALNTVFDRPVAASADAMAQRPLGVFFSGLLMLLLAVPVLAILAASVIGLAIVPFVMCAMVVAGLVGKTAVARAIGRSLVRPRLPEGRVLGLMTFVIGFALLTLAYMVPVLAFVTWALTSVLGLGAAAVTFRSFWRSERPASVPAAQPARVATPAVVVAPAPASAAPPPDDMPPPPVAPPIHVDAPPPPPPPVARGLAQYPRASFLDRVAAFALDCLLVAISAELLDMGRYEGFFLLLLLAYHIAFWAWKGTTLGGIICNLRVIRTHGADLRFADALVRGLSSVFSLAALGIGCLWMLQDPERQMWHDKIAGTLVVKVPRELVLP